MTVSIFEWQELIPRPRLGLYLKDRTGKNQLLDLIRRRLQQRVVPIQQRTPNNLPAYVDLYGEQVTWNAMADLSKYFRLQQIRGRTAGGLPTGLSALAIQPKDIRPSNTAVAVIGEGLTGWFFEQAGWVPLARPIGGPSDLVLTDANRTSYALVQVKSTQQKSIISQMRSSVVEHLEHVAHVQTMDPQSTYTCEIVGVVIKGGNDFDVLRLSVHMR